MSDVFFVSMNYLGIRIIAFNNESLSTAASLKEYMVEPAQAVYTLKHVSIMRVLLFGLAMQDNANEMCTKTR